MLFKLLVVLSLEKYFRLFFLGQGRVVVGVSSRVSSRVSVRVSIRVRVIKQAILLCKLLIAVNSS